MAQRRGGHLQQAAEAVSARSRTPAGRRTYIPNTELVTDDLSYEHLLDWSWGEVSASRVQQLAAAAVRVGAQAPLLSVLARLGNEGANPQNISRQIVNRVCKKLIGHLVHALPDSDCDTWIRPDELMHFFF